MLHAVHFPDRSKGPELAEQSHSCLLDQSGGAAAATGRHGFHADAGACRIATTAAAAGEVTVPPEHATHPITADEALTGAPRCHAPSAMTVAKRHGRIM